MIEKIQKQIELMKSQIRESKDFFAEKLKIYEDLRECIIAYNKDDLSSTDRKRILKSLDQIIKLLKK